MSTETMAPMPSQWLQRLPIFQSKHVSHARRTVGGTQCRWWGLRLPSGSSPSSRSCTSSTSSAELSHRIASSDDFLHRFASHGEISHRFASSVSISHRFTSSGEVAHRVASSAVSPCQVTPATPTRACSREVFLAGSKPGLVTTAGCPPS